METPQIETYEINTLPVTEVLDDRLLKLSESDLEELQGLGHSPLCRVYSEAVADWFLELAKYERARRDMKAGSLPPHPFTNMGPREAGSAQMFITLLSFAAVSPHLENLYQSFAHLAVSTCWLILMEYESILRDFDQMEQEEEHG